MCFEKKHAIIQFLRTEKLKSITQYNMKRLLPQSSVYKQIVKFKTGHKKLKEAMHA